MTVRSVFCMLVCMVARSAFALSIAFVNPGKSNETYWVSVTQAMQDAATSLGIHFEVAYAERDHLRMVDLTRQFVNRPPDKRPDILILTNERRMGGPQLKIAEAAGVDTFFAFSSILPEDRAEYGEPRGRYRHWLGSLQPHAEDAGYQTAKALIEQGLAEHRQGPDGKLHMLAIAGDRSTEVSIRRNQGMQRAVAEHPNVVLDQVVYADWQRARAAEQARVLYARYPHTQLIWTGNDEMAFGAMDTLAAEGGQAGRDRIFSTINTSPDAMQAIEDGRLAVLSGGHFMTGAWAMVMLYDYRHGHDLAPEGLDLDKPMFTLFDRKAAQRYLVRFGHGIRGIDFHRFSKALNPSLKQYDFRFSQLIE